MTESGRSARKVRKESDDGKNAIGTNQVPSLTPSATLRDAAYQHLRIQRKRARQGAARVLGDTRASG
jgi:hypothetical protein